MFGRPKRHTIGPAALRTEEQLSTEGGALHQRAAGGPEAPLCKGSCQREAMTEGLMLSKSKIAKQYSTAPGFKNKLESIYKPMSTRQIYYRPPGARFFLLQRRKNRGRKTPPRAGAVPRPWNPPLHTVSVLQPHTVRATKQICTCIRTLPASVQTACRFAVAYALPW